MENYDASCELLLSTVETVNKVMQEFAFEVESEGGTIHVNVVDKSDGAKFSTVAYGTEPGDVFGEFYGAAKMLFAIRENFELKRRVY